MIGVTEQWQMSLSQETIPDRGKLNAWLRRASTDVYKQQDKSLSARKPFVPVLQWSPFYGVSISNPENCTLS